MQNHYKTLGIPYDASPLVIKKAYRQLCLKYHPDTNGGNNSNEEILRNIVEAYDVLSDAAKKTIYDIRLRAAINTFPKEKVTPNPQPPPRPKQQTYSKPKGNREDEVLEELRKKAAAFNKQQQEKRQQEQTSQKGNPNQEKKAESNTGEFQNRQGDNKDNPKTISKKLFVNPEYHISIGLLVLLLFVVFIRVISSQNEPVKSEPAKTDTTGSYSATFEKPKMRRPHLKRRDSVKSFVADTANSSINANASPPITNIKTDTMIPQQDTIKSKDTTQNELKPKWYQFRKRKQLKKEHNLEKKVFDDIYSR